MVRKHDVRLRVYFLFLFFISESPFFSLATFRVALFLGYAGKDEDLFLDTLVAAGGTCNALVAWPGVGRWREMGSETGAWGATSRQLNIFV